MRSRYFLTRRRPILQQVLLVGFLMLLASCADNQDDSGQNEVKVPQNIVANPGSKLVELSWSAVNGADTYTVYWRAGEGIENKADANAGDTDIPHFLHNNVSNGVTYYYRITAKENNKESALSTQVQATPSQLPPDQPVLKQGAIDGFTAYAGDGEVVLQWPENVSLGAERFALLWQLGEAAEIDTMQRIENVRPPYVHQGLINGQLYSYRLIGINDEGESQASEEVVATPGKNAPSTPKDIEVTVGSRQVQLNWVDVSNAGNFEIYWNTTGGVSLSDNRIRNVTPPFTHAPLNNSQTYYYRIRGVNSGGAGELSGELQATPALEVINRNDDYAPLQDNVLSPPQGVTVGIEDKRLILSWSNLASARGYNIYWNTTGNVTTADNKLTNVVVFPGTNGRLSFVHNGLVNGQDYFYRVAAFNDGDDQIDEVLSAEVGPTVPEAIIPGKPTNVRAIAGDKWAAIRWNPVRNTDHYKLIWSQEGSASVYIVQPVQSPYTLNGLINDSAYQLQIAAVPADGEEKLSNAVFVTPQIEPPSAPTEVRLTPDDHQVTIEWKANGQDEVGLDEDTRDEEVTGYRVYWSNTPGVKSTVADGGLNLNVLDVSGTSVVHNQPPLTNGQRHYYVVTAVNAGGESLPSQEVWAVPNRPTPGAPAGINAQAGEKSGQIIINWQPPQDSNETDNLSYNLYWQSSSPDGRSDVQVIPNITSPHTLKDLSNGVSYYFKVSAINEGGEGIFSPEVSAIPILPAPKLAPNKLQALSGQDARVQLSWNDPNSPPDGEVIDPEQVISYTIYWSTSEQIDFNYGPRIEGVSSQSFSHTGLINGLTYYYRITAVNGGGESPVSGLQFATPQMPAPGQAPDNIAVLAGDTQVSILFDEVASASNYTLYWSADPNLPVDQWAQIQGVISGASHSGLTNGTRYYFSVRASNAGGDGPFSNFVNAMPQEPPPEAPSGITAISDDQQNIINWDSQAGLSYRLYWSTTEGVDASSNRIANVQASYIHAGLDNDIGPYYYRLQAENAGGFSPLSAEVSADPASEITGAPIGLSAQARDGQVELTWLPPAGADANTTYTLYWSFLPGDQLQRTAIPNVRSPFIHTNRTNNTDYYYTVTATNESGESPHSAQTRARPMPAIPGTPASLQAVAGQNQVTLSWSAVSGVTHYTVYWATNAQFDPLSGSISIDTPQIQFTHTELENDTSYYYYVTAANISGESSPSYSVSATTAQEPNQAPVILYNNNSTVVLSRSIGLGGQVNLTLNGNDPNGDSLSWTVTQLPGQGIVTPSSASGEQISLIYQHDGNNYAQDVMWLEVNDGRGGVDSLQITININNRTPVFDVSIPPVFSVAENTTTVGVVSATDDDGDTVSYSFATGLDESHFELDPGTGALQFTTAPNYDDPQDAGADNVYQLSIIADDGVGRPNSQARINVAVQISNENELAINSVPLTLASENQLYNYPVTIDDSDIVAGATYSYRLNTAPTGMTIDANGLISWTPDAAAVAASPHNVVVQVRDSSGGDTAVQSYTLTVNAAGAVPLDPAQSVATINAATPLGVGMKVSITVQAVDAAGANMITGGAAVAVVSTDANPVSLSTAAIPPTVIDNGDGTYSAEWYVDNAGVDNYAITMNGSAISGSYSTDTQAVPVAGLFSVTDANLQTCMNNLAAAFDWTYAHQITTTALNEFYYCDSWGIDDLSGAQYLSNIQDLFLYGNAIRDVTVLQDLRYLNEIGLGANGLTSIDDVVGLTSLPNVSILWLSDSPLISDYSGLSAMANLTELIVWRNNISDLSASGISGLSNLTRLWLLGNPITSVTPLIGNSNLVNLGLSQLPAGINSIADITDLASLSNLQVLWLQGNSITDATGLTSNNFPVLQELYLANNSINLNVSQLETLAALSDPPLSILDVSGNNIMVCGDLESLLSAFGGPGNDIMTPNTAELGVNCAAGTPSAENSIAVIAPDTAVTTGDVVTITVQVRDQFNSNITASVGANAVAGSITESSANTGPLNFIDNGDGTYSASYVPPNPGTDTYEITLNSTALGTGPYSKVIDSVSISNITFDYTALGDCVNAMAALNEWTLAHQMTGTLECGDLGSDSLAGLERLTNIQEMRLYGNAISDVTALANLPNLTALDLGNNGIGAIEDVAGLTDLSSLQSLYLYSNQISDLTGLSAFASLTTLSLYNNRVGSSAATRVVPNATSSWFPSDVVAQPGDGQVTLDWTVQANTTYSVTWLALDADNTQEPEALIDVTPPVVINGLTNSQTYKFYISVETVDTKVNATAIAIPKANAAGAPGAIRAVAGNNQVVVHWEPAAQALSYSVRVWDDTGALVGEALNATSPQTIPNLDNGVMHYVRVDAEKAQDDLAPIAGLTNLDKLYLGGNSIGELGALSGMDGLLELGVEENFILDITPITGTTFNQLTHLWLRNNNITDIDALQNLSSLTLLSLYANNVMDIGPALDNQLPNLQFLYLGYNKISDLSALQSHGALEVLGLETNRIGDSLTSLAYPELQASNWPRSVKIVSKDGAVEISWQAPPGAVSFNVSWDTIFSTPDNNGFINNIVAPLNLTISGLKNYTTYRFVVEAVDGFGNTAWYAKAATPRPVFPGAPTELGAVAGDTEVTLSWINSQNPATTSYAVRWYDYRTGQSGVVANAIPATPGAYSELVVTGLTNFGMHAFRVTAENSGSDVAQLSGLNGLTELGLSSNSISDVSPLAGLGGLTSLNLAGNYIYDISSFETPVVPNTNFTQLEYLNLSFNVINDINPLQYMTSLTNTNLRDNGVMDPAPVTGLPNLSILDLANNNITDLGTPWNLPLLNWLSLGDTNISDISSLTNLTTLTALHLNSANITDISILDGRFSALTTLRLDGNGISDVGQIGAITGLDVLNLSNNSSTVHMTNVDTLVNFTNPSTIDLSGNILGCDELQQLIDRYTSNVVLPSQALADQNCGATLIVDALPQVNDLNLRSCIQSAVSAKTFTYEVDDVSCSAIGDITGLAQFSNMRFLALTFGNISDITELNSLPLLETATLRFNDIYDLSPLANASNLWLLDIENNQLGDTASGTAVPMIKNTGAPQNFVAVPGDSEATLNWTVEAGVTYTLIGYSEAHDDSVTLLGYTTNILPPYTITGLLNNQTSKFFLAASGPGHATYSIAFARPMKTSWSAPSAVNVLADNSTATVNWSNAQDPTVSSYSLTWIDEAGNQFTRSPAVSGEVITGLQNGSTYHFLVTANGGVSDLSIFANANIQETLRVLYAKENNIKDISSLSGLTNLQTLELERNHIHDLGGMISGSYSAMSTFNVFYNYIFGTFPMDIMPNARVINLGGNLFDGISMTQPNTNLFSLNVFATNISEIDQLENRLGNIDTLSIEGAKFGESARAAAIPQAADTLAPQNVRVTPGEYSVTVEWDPGVGATSYDVLWESIYGGLDGSLLNTSSGVVITGLVNQATYRVTVVANGAVASASRVVETQTTTGFPDAPASFTAQPGDGQVVLSWMDPAKAVDSYTVYTISSSGLFSENTVNAPANTFTVTGLANGENHTFQITANRAGANSSLNAFSSLSSLRYFYGGYNAIGRLDAFGSLGALEFLHAQNSPVYDVSVLTGNPLLQQLWLDKNMVSDVSDIGANMAGFSLQLNIDDNNVAPLAGLSSLTSLSNTSQLNLLRNSLTSCTDLDALIAGFPGTVNPAFTNPGVNCTP